MTDSAGGKNWIWENQLESKEDWPTITNNQGSQIYIAPRQYILQLQFNRKGESSIEKITSRISLVKPLVTSTHNYKAAPEPLNQLISHFQLLAQEAGKYLYVNLTNISSQIIRKKLINHILEVYEDDYSPKKLWIITGHRQARPKCYETLSKDAVLKALLTAQAKITEMELMERVYQPWNYTAIVLLTHIAQNKDQAIKPIRERNQPIQQNQADPKKIKAAIINKIYKNKAVPASPTQSISSTESWMDQLDRIEKQHTTHSSSTKTTLKRTGDTSPQPGPSKRRVSSHSITETTSISSSPRPIQEETAQESEPESPSFLVRQAQEVQKRLSLFPKLNFSGTSFSIASVTVSKQSISMEIKSNNN
uniref:Non-structural protein 2 n=1 Tax=Culex pipiens pallens densovirus TaxID=465914 RepID=A9XMV4_AEDEB|nr:non-structural protein 2 [Culex pipiens pallens densovirus]ABU94970.1 non-structural protein 2 [Culex pipiens pallens densovirus]ABU94973.1 non-structural protein 2 [Culex pipiens pallens densovirus]ABU94976.1 non-structural protein 2 [Culex pipiens pallens densovirus]ABU94979.1 non-structural protein 2 [Culex pipiens pallens densovirus]